MRLPAIVRRSGHSSGTLTVGALFCTRKAEERSCTYEQETVVRRYRASAAKRHGEGNVVKNFAMHPLFDRPAPCEEDFRMATLRRFRSLIVHGNRATTTSRIWRVLSVAPRSHLCLPGPRPASLQRVFGGTGLGLWISKEILDRHNARLMVRSSQRTHSAGSVFRMSLPFDASVRKA